MTDPQRLVKDSVLSVATIDNFAEELASESEIVISLPDAADQEWWLVAQKNTRDGIEHLGLYIKIGETNSQECSVRFGISLRNENYLSDRSTFTRDYISNDTWGAPCLIGMSHVLAENNGFLIDGALTVQCEVRVCAITDRNGIRMFNFLDPFEGCVQFTMENSQKTFYAMKEMVMFHSPLLAKKIAAGKDMFTFRRYVDQPGEDFEWFLQLIHGLSAGQLPEWSLSSILDYAIDFGAFNVIQRSDIIFSKFLFHVSTPVKSIRLERQMKRVKSLKELKEVVEEYQWIDFDSETMKRVASKFFSFSVDFRRPTI